jgi:ribonuclease J
VARYIPQNQRVQIKRSGRFDLLDNHRAHRIFEEQLAEIAPKATMLFRPAMLGDLDHAGCITSALAIWSQWEGYLGRGRGQALAAELAARNIPIEYAHTSGHASIKDLKRLAGAISPKMLVPVHTYAPHAFPEHFDAVALKQDGEWWEVA